jgi:hypothetical protein
MAYRVVTLVALLMLSSSATAVSAQTLRQFKDAIATARTESDLAATDQAIDREIVAHLAVLGDSRLLDCTYEELAAVMHGPKMASIARMPGRVCIPPAPVWEAVRRLQGRANFQLAAALEAKLGEARADQILEPVSRFHLAQLEASIARSNDILARYERKFGPDSARLNGVEVVLNYGLQRLPKFGPDPDGLPGSLEAIASYSPTYMTYVDGKARMISLSEFGLRGYLFGEKWGRKGRMGLVRPAFWTVGLAVASGEDGALKWPWKGRTRLGGFVSWGELKVAYVAGDDQRLVVSRQFQLIPWAF